MKDQKISHPHIIKGKPLFKRHLYISSALFVIIIVITTYILIQLAFDFLKDRINTEMIKLSEVCAQQIRDQIQMANAQMRTLEATSGIQRDREIQNYFESLLAEQEEIIYVFVQDLSGEILWKSVRRGMELEQNHFAKLLFFPKNPRPPRLELVSLSNPSNRYADLIEPIFLNDQTQLIAHLGLDSVLLEKRSATLRDSILNRILLASSVVVGILTLALFYVLWLLKRAQVVEAEAHTADRLAYLGTLASGLAHEIRNPLSAINLNLQMIEEEITTDDKKGSDLGTMLAGTKQEIRRLDRLATNFLFYAKPINLEKQVISVSDILDDVVLLVSQECEKSGIKLIRQDGPGPFDIRADRDLLIQAVLNLIVNAQDAVSSKPTGDKVIMLGVTQEEDNVVIRVRDLGCGIGPEEIHNLFQLFYSSKRGGTGLGLPIAQRIVESHGGRIEWKNHREGGAEFSIWLKSAKM